MKKVLLSGLILFSAVLFVQAQGTLVLKDKSGAVISNTSFDISGDTSSQNTMSYLFDAYNASGVAKTYYMKRMIVSEIPGSQNYFCWDVCYPPFVSTSPNGVVINTLATYTLGTVDYQPLGNWGMTTIRYVFWDYNNSSDSSWFTVRWNAGITGVQEETSGMLSPAYPNPASSHVKLGYSLNGSDRGTVRIYNMLGNLVREVTVSADKNALSLDVAELESGIYFYSLSAGDKVLATRKLVISR